MIGLWALLSCGGGADRWCERFNLYCEPTAEARALVVDADRDGWAPPEDCDDYDPEKHPSAAEVCDNIDNNCDGQRDEGLPTEDWFPDQDRDGYGDASMAPVVSCQKPLTDWIPVGQDCNDANPTIHPGAVERCDGVDQNCSGQIDEDAVDQDTLYVDADGDGEGDPARPVETCDPADAGRVVSGQDCDDTRADVYPAAPEVYDGADNDCDGLIDVVAYRVSWRLRLSAPPISLANLGAVEGDGHDVLAIGHYVDDQGFVEVITSTQEGGLRSVTLSGEVGGRAGAALHGIGDADGDGFGDFVIGDDLLDTAAHNAGGVYLLYGPALERTTDTADALLLGEGASSYTGGALGSGDLDGDGAVDLLVGATKQGVGGTVWAVLGPVTAGTPQSLSDVAWLRLEGATAGDNFGRALAGVGDVDGDGLDDILVGAHGVDQAGSEAGAVYLYREGGTWASPFLGEGVNAAAGFAVAGAGDVDGDGLADFVVGAHNTVRGKEQVGVAYVIAGGAVWPEEAQALDEAALARVEGSHQGELLGYTVSGLGDIDGDGLADVGVGAPGADTVVAGGGLQHVAPGEALRDGGVVGTLAYGSLQVGAKQGEEPLLTATLEDGVWLVMVLPQEELLHLDVWPD